MGRLRDKFVREALSAFVVPTLKGWLRAWESSPRGWPNIEGKRIYLMGFVPFRKRGPEGEAVKTENGTGSAQ